METEMICSNRLDWDFSLSAQSSETIFVHCCFNNILYDKKSKQLTILDKEMICTKRAPLIDPAEDFPFIADT